ncbi:MAG TPA: hypothetical protein VNV66_15880 [Pilimelia sp.]|nr:hypothetical protein [Pilimelia sp.]
MPVTRFLARFAATAVTAVLLCTGVSATAAAAQPTASRAASGCSTWQYVVKSSGTIRYSPGGAETGVWARPGDLVNVHQFSGPWYRGNFYWEFGRYYSDGWILSNHLDYLRCW